MRIVYSPLDCREIADGEPEPTRWFSSRSASRRRRLPTRWPSGMAKRRGLKNFSVLVSHVLVPPAMTAILSVARTIACRGSSAAGHVCTVMGYDGIRADSPPLSRADRDHRLRAARPARRDLSAPFNSSKRARGGREPVCPRCPPRRQPCGAANCSRTYSRSATANGAASARSRRAAIGCGPSTPSTTPSSGLRSKTSDRGIDGLHQRADPQGLEEAARVSGLRQDCTPQTPLGATMVSSEGACAAYYNYGRISPIRGSGS